MQFRLRFNKIKETSIVPLNYRYDISKSITQLLDKGCDQIIKKSLFRRIQELKTFTFGDLNFDFSETHPKEELIEHNGQQAVLDIRFLIDKTEENLLKGLLLNQWLKLGESHYQIIDLKSTESIEFRDVMAYRCICPLSLSANGVYGESNYLSPRDQNFHKSFKINLIKKVLRSHPEVAGLKDLDQYCPEFQFKLLTEPREKGLQIKTCDDGRLDVIGYQFDFQLKASPILHELGFYEGFGLQHSMGLGFVEVIS